MVLVVVHNLEKIKTYRQEILSDLQLDTARDITGDFLRFPLSQVFNVFLIHPTTTTTTSTTYEYVCLQLTTSVSIFPLTRRLDARVSTAILGL